MTAKLYSCSFTGLQCRIIEVQADISNGLSSFSIVGMGDISVQESKERIRSSIKNSGMIFPRTKKTINLAPAQIKKQGSLFDLPIAIGLLLASNQIQFEKIPESVMVGELSLNGQIRAVSGILPIVQHAKEQGFKNIFIPKDNALEASFIDKINIYPLENLKEFADFCSNKKEIKPYPHSEFKNFPNSVANEKSYLFSQIAGHQKAKRAISLAAAGRHNILFRSSPGCGKTILARAFRDLLTKMNDEEILETTKIYSVAGLLDKDTPIIVNRPFREVHHTASLVSVVGGGGINPKPGEISLANNGVLFLDEIAEFPRNILEALRQPLEDKYIHISRSNFSVKFPSNFILVATMNPCQCGYNLDRKTKCICTDSQLKNYQKRLSGPILDRFDIFLDIEKVSVNNFFGEDFNKNLKQQSEIFRSIKIAELAQSQRFRDHKNIRSNSDMNLLEIRKYCGLKKDAKSMLDKAVENLNLSNRGYLRTLKIARTIADLDKEPEIKTEHVAEAIQYRSR